MERNASLELEQQQQLSVLDTRQSRISELERQLAQQGDATIQWKDQYASAEGDRNALQRELASYVRVCVRSVCVRRSPDRIVPLLCVTCDLVHILPTADLVERM